MNSHYELLNLFPATLSDEETTQEHERIVTLLKTFGGIVLNHEFYGRKKLAYQIAAQKSGVYSNIEFELEPEKTTEFKSSMKLNAKIQRFHLTRYVAPNKRIVPSPADVAAKKETEVKPKELKPEDLEKLDTKIEELLTEEIN